MKTWRDYFESKEEDKEEKTGIDFDHDKEAGESKVHKGKVEKKHKEMLDFFEARKEGAKKIAREAKAKGGASLLTALHFEAKDGCYMAVISAIKNNKLENYFRSKFISLLAKLRHKNNQHEFQRISGEAEVWGEAISELFS